MGWRASSGGKGDIYTTFNSKEKILKMNKNLKRYIALGMLCIFKKQMFEF